MKPKMARSFTAPIPPFNIESRPVMSQHVDSFERSSPHSLSIDEWSTIYSQHMETSCSLSNSLHNICQCCGNQDCDNLDYFNQLIRKLESDTRLAAELGQGLLQQHELFVLESNQQRATLEKKVEEQQQRIHVLEQSLEEVEDSKSDITKEKNKWFWEYQKRQKNFDETVSDLESANDKCNQLSKELDLKSNELEKLRLFKFMARHSESREETLTSKLEDTYQELAICRKNELLLESKIKKLQTKYENLCNSHEIMLQDFQHRIRTTQHTNNKSTIDTTKHVSYSDTNDFIDLIKELSLANTKLKLDLMDCRNQLSESKVQVIALNQKLEDMNESPNSTPTLQDDLKSILKRPTSSRKPPSKYYTLQYPPQPTASTSLPTSSLEESPRHHHFLYEKHQNSVDNSETTMLSPSFIPDTTPEMIKSPFFMLQEHVTHVIEKLRATDIRALNRRLKRAFDIVELSNMSNSIIDNILMDLDTLESRFLWVQPHPPFFAILDLFKDILKEVGVLRSTMNELQVEYVKKVEESQARVEEEIIRKRQQKATAATPAKSNPFAWFTYPFYYNKSKNKLEHPNNTTTTTTSSSIITGSSSEISSHHYYDKNSTMTKTTVSSNSLASPDEEEQHIIKKPIDNHIRINTFPRQVDGMKRRQIPYFPPMASSLSSGTSRSTPSIPIRGKRNVHRINIDYEGIGPAAIRPIPSDRDNVDWKATNFSSSWLGGK